jgi:hypothetical protein
MEERVRKATTSSHDLFRSNRPVYQVLNLSNLRIQIRFRKRGMLQVAQLLDRR